MNPGSSYNLNYSSSSEQFQQPAAASSSTTTARKGQPKLQYRHSQSWSTSSSDLLRSHTPAQSPPQQPPPPLPTRTPPLSPANFVGYYHLQQPQSTIPSSSNEMYYQQQQQDTQQRRPSGPQRTPSGNATLTLGSFAPTADPTAAHFDGRAAAATSAYPDTGLAAPIALHPAQQPQYAVVEGVPAQPSFGTMMDHYGGAGAEGPMAISSGDAYYYPQSQGADPSLSANQLTPQHAAHAASPSSASSPGVPVLLSPGATAYPPLQQGQQLSRNPSTSYAESSLLNSPPPKAHSNSSSPPPAAYSSSTMMHVNDQHHPSISLHSRTGSQQALAANMHSQAHMGSISEGVNGGIPGAVPVNGNAVPGAGGKAGLVGPSNSTSNRLNKSLIPSKNSGIFMAVILIEAIAVTTMVVIVFSLIEARIKIKVQYLKTVPVYLSIFVLGMVFEVLIALDAVRLKNTIQVVGVAIFNVALTVTAALEITQVRDALERQDIERDGIPCHFNQAERCSAVDTLYYPLVQKFLIVVPILTGLAQIPITILTYYLFRDFGWAIYRKIGADLRIRNMFLWYQVFVVWLKFDFFFGGAFTIAYLIIVADENSWEYPVTIAAVPAAFIVLFMAAFAVRREIHFLMWICIAGFVAGMVYFLYKLASIFVPRTSAQYTTVRLTLPFFSIFATVSLIFTLINACICLYNFGKGLREAHDSFGSFGGLWTNSRSHKGGGFSQTSAGGRIMGRSPSSANQLNRFGAGGAGGYVEGDIGKTSLNTSMDSTTGMKRVMMGGNGPMAINGGPGMAVDEDGGVYEMTTAGSGPPRRPRISID
ncbi:hypothetical protein OC846_006334 [Tilletia horrida]|uniref:TRP C-terminal domain-containing protein n=1 Tax=Tilletia horrida TaxID=155126 RepID=A0AAN6GJ13_9BASI|nr:hypothetical protein OC845_006353 [Tilletia horrida]KAK0543673.1 hypothetical protein OC846_006334 [Tilletia horrida]KAK0560028.1 hypothetical protein OC861_006439 [Tilletia horrida]